MTPTMTPVLFYGVPEGCSFGSIVALEWSGLDYRLCRIEMPSTVTSDAFKRINPVAETPALLTSDGRFISQSFAILHHIGASAPASPLVPRPGSAAFDRFNEVLAFLNTGFFESFAPLWYALEHDKQGPELELLNTIGRSHVQKAHADLERMLKGSQWLAGDQRTAADAYFMGIARWNDFHRVLDRRDYPAVHQLHERLARDPAVQFAHAVEHQDAARSAGGFKGHVDLAALVSELDARQVA